MGAFQPGAFQTNAFQGANPQTVTPGVASLTLTAFAPAVRTPRLVTPATASLTITRLAPTVSAPRLVTAGKASLTLTTFAPAVFAPRLVTVGKASLTTASFAPSVATPRLVTPETASLSLGRTGDLRLTASGIPFPVQTVYAILRGTGDPGYQVALLVDTANAFGYGVNRIVLALTRVDGANEATLTLATADTGLTGTDLGSFEWTITAEITGDPTSVLLSARAVRFDADVSVQATDSYSIARSDETLVQFEGATSRVEHVGLAPTVSVAGSSASVTPGTASLSLIPYAPNVQAGGATGHRLGVLTFGPPRQTRPVPVPVAVSPAPARLFLTTYEPSVDVNDDDLVMLLAA